MLLEELSLDCLHQVFGLIEPYDIGHLWCCGSKKLQWIFCEGRVLHKFEYEFNPRFSLLFPRLVSHLSSLTHLSVSYEAYRRSLQQFVPVMPSLPQNLQYLELNQKRAIIDMREQISANPDHFSQLHTLILQQHNVKIAKTMDLRRLSALKILKLLGPSLAHPPFHLVHLPPDLVDLTVHIFVATPEWASSLPAGLTRLELLMRESTPFFHLLPAGLLDLKLEHNLASPELLEWHTLPRGLQSFQNTQYCMVKPSMVAMLPPTLKELYINVSSGGYPSDMERLALWKEMPLTLKKMSQWFWPRVLSKSLAEALPRSLCQAIPLPVSVDAISFLPKGIEALVTQPSVLTEKSPSIEYPPHLLELNHRITSKEALSILPPNITRLETVRIEEPLSKEMALLFPKKLRYLTLYSPHQRQTAEAWIDLPRTLDCLQLSANTFETAEQEHEISKKMAQNLPPFLRKMWFHYAIVSQEFYSGLPKTLKELALTIKELPLTSYEALSQFPVLSSLSLRTAQAPASWRPYISSMSRTMHSFNWNCINPVTIPWQTDLVHLDLLNLPRGLSNLWLPNSPNIDFSCVSNVPPFLQSCWFGSLQFSP